MPQRVKYDGACVKKQTLFDLTRGVRGRIKFRCCGHLVYSIEEYEETGNICRECFPKAYDSFFVPNTSEFFNVGLGCMTKGTRHAERIAKKKGLVPIGDARLKDIFKDSDIDC